MSNRLARVSELLKREVGQALERDFHFEGVLVTVHHVNVASDLRAAQVYIGIVGDEKRFRSVIDTLNRKHGQIQKQVSKRVVLKYTPQLHFIFDNSVERGVRVVNLLDEIAGTMPAGWDDEDDGRDPVIDGESE